MQRFLIIDNKIKKAQYLFDLLFGCSFENFLTFALSSFELRKIKKFYICSSFHST